MLPQNQKRGLTVLTGHTGEGKPQIASHKVEGDLNLSSSPASIQLNPIVSFSNFRPLSGKLHEMIMKCFNIGSNAEEVFEPTIRGLVNLMALINY